MIYESFVYCWTDHKTGMLYVGSHKGTVDDGYVCSSKWMREQYATRPEDFTRHIVAHGSVADIRRLETAILLSVDAARDRSFYNKHNTVGSYYIKAHTEQTKRKIGESNRGRKRPDLSARNKLGHSEETRAKIGSSREYLRGTDNPGTGVPRSEETKAKIRRTKKINGCAPKTKEHIENIRAKARLPKSPETRAKMSAAAKLREETKRASKT